MHSIFKIRVPTLAFYGRADTCFSPLSWQGAAPFNGSSGSCGHIL